VTTPQDPGETSASESPREPEADDHRAGRAVPGSGRSDAELLRMHVAGDTEAFGVLFTRHRDRLWALAVRTLADPEEAADALQEAMISAFRRAGSFRGDSAVTTWLHRIVVNSCLDRMRRRAARPVTTGSDERTLDRLALSRAGPDPASDSDIALDVRAALRQLPPEQQAALVLVDMLGYPVADAALVLGVSVGTIKSRCARGRARLLPKLAFLRAVPYAGPPAGARSSAATGQPEPPGNRSATGAVLPAQEGGDTAS
jgi:RNA polymerase sigma-70 factor (ECF subfamily)